MQVEVVEAPPQQVEADVLAFPVSDGVPERDGPLRDGLRTPAASRG